MIIYCACSSSNVFSQRKLSSFCKLFSGEHYHLVKLTLRFHKLPDQIHENVRFWDIQRTTHPSRSCYQGIQTPGSYVLFCWAHICGKQEITCTLSCVQIQSLEEHKEWKHSQRTMQAQGDHLVFLHNSANQTASLWDGRVRKYNLKRLAATGHHKGEGSTFFHLWGNYEHFSHWKL